MDVFPDLRRLRFVSDKYIEKYIIREIAHVRRDRKFIEDRLRAFSEGGGGQQLENIKVRMRRRKRNAAPS